MNGLIRLVLIGMFLYYHLKVRRSKCCDELTTDIIDLIFVSDRSMIRFID